MKNLLFLFISTSLLLSSCGKLVTESHPDFVGTWYATDATNSYILVIQPNNEARFDRMNFNGDTITTYLGTAKVRDSDVMVIGNLKLSIDEYPIFDATIGTQGAWRCKLETWPFVKQ